MPSLDIVSEIDKVELTNAVDHSNKEILNRFDFKGSGAHITLSGYEITLYADNDFQLTQMRDILVAKLSKRSIDIRYLKTGQITKISGNKLKELIQISNGIETEQAKIIISTIKALKLKVQTSIQGTEIRVTGNKRDDLQEVMAHLKDFIIPLQFINFRD